jgi:putative spermidine/putrescine transport system ATP-binding protein
MSQGRLEQIAAPADLYANPATPFVAEFVGLNNRIPGEASDGAARILDVTIPTLPGSVTGQGVALVRPESVTLTPDPGGAASVAAVAFLGPISRVSVTLADGTLAVAQIASAQAQRLSVGEPVTVGIDPAPVLVVART